MAKMERFDAGDVDPSRAFDPIPAGWYVARIVASDIKPNSNDPNASHLWLEFELDEGMHPDLKGRKVWTRLNRWHRSQETREIADRDFSALCRAAGVMQVDDSEQLHGIPIAIKVKLRPAEPAKGFDASNDVNGYDAAAARFGGGQSAAVAPSRQSSARAAAPATRPAQPSTPPWQR